MTKRRTDNSRDTVVFLTAEVSLAQIIIGLSHLSYVFPAEWITPQQLDSLNKSVQRLSQRRKSK
jgi:hypothetical protein